MATVTEMIKELREKTGAGIMDCKKALDTCGNDMARAYELLKEKGIEVAAKKATRVTNQGVIDAYVHMGKAGALVELNCETDFVARTSDFRELAHDLAMQVVAASPIYVSPEDVPTEAIEAQKATWREELAAENKPAAMFDKIMEGKLAKFYADVCILKQPFIKDQERTVEDVIKGVIAKTGENIVLRRFVRLALSEILE